MPSTVPGVVATTVHKVTLKPTVRRQLLTELKTYAELKSQAKALEQAMEMHKAKIGAIRAETGETAIEIEGFKITYVTGERKILNKELLLQQGVTMAQIEAATETKPNKPYDKVTCPGDKEREF